MTPPGVEQSVDRRETAGDLDVDQAMTTSSVEQNVDRRRQLSRYWLDQTMTPSGVEQAHILAYDGREALGGSDDDSLGP